MLLYQILLCTILIKRSYEKNTFKTSAPTWNEKFELTDGLYSVSVTQNYFEYLSTAATKIKQ